ncbi:MAG: hypothetical protein KAH25_09050, partial [Bacteroidales bacterium]|nr:hypothetical protein [Bacteroidales bacterium]
MKKVVLSFLSVILVAVIISSCKKDKDEPTPDPQPQVNELIIGDNTKPIEFSSRTDITEIDTSDYTFFINGSSVFLSSLEIGDIIVDSTSPMAPYGYMRKITSINGDKGEKVIHTEQALLYEAIKQASIEFSTGNLKMSHIKSVHLAKGVKLKTSESDRFRAFEFSFDKLFGDETMGVYIEGETYFDLDFFWNFEWSLVHDDIIPFEIDLCETGIEFGQGASINVTGYGTYVESTEFQFASIEFTPWTIMAGPVPLVFVPTVDFYVNMDGEISAQITTGVSETFEQRLGIKYTSDNGWENISGNEFESTFIVPSIQANASIEASVGPRAGLFLYGIAGPTVGIEAYTRLEAEILTKPTYNIDFDIGLRGNAGIEMTIFGFEILNKKVELFDISKNLYHLEDGTTEESISIISPINNAQIAIGSIQNITIYTTGATPEKVEFYANDILLGESLEMPFSFIWNTNTFDSGDYALKAKSIFVDHELESDVIDIKMVVAGWTKVDFNDMFSDIPEYTDLQDIFILDENNIWISTSMNDGQVFYSSDAGDSWSYIYNGEGIDKLSVWKPLFLNATSGVSVNGNHEVVKTVDGGASWIDLHVNETYGFTAQGVVRDVNGSILLFGSTGGNYGLLKYDLNVEEAGDLFLFSEDDCEMGWSFTNAVDIQSRSNGLFVPNLKEAGSNGSNKLGIINGNVINLVDVGMSEDDHIVDMFFLNDNNAWLLTNSSYLYKSDDGGLNWEMIYYGAPAGTVDNDDIFFVNSNLGYGTSLSYDGKVNLYKTTDGGYNWLPVEG